MRYLFFICIHKGNIKKITYTIKVIPKDFEKMKKTKNIRHDELIIKQINLK